MKVTNATLGGFPLLDLETVGWAFTQGVRPYVRRFEMHRKDVDALWRATEDTGVQLVIEWDGIKDPLVVKKLSVLTRGAGSHPNRASVEVADVRWRWTRPSPPRTFNRRRRSGEKRIVDGVLQRVEPVADITYARYSLKDELRPWTATDAVYSILDDVTGKNYDFPPSLFRNQLPVDNLRFMGMDGQETLKAIFQLVPGLTGWIDEEGQYRGTLTSGGGEGAEVKAFGVPLEDEQLAELVDLSRVRPSGVDVYFVCEDEIRFDFVEGESYTTSEREPRTCENVLPLPDVTLTISGKKYVRGQWVPITQALLDAWNADTTSRLMFNGKTLPPVSFEKIRKLWLAPSGYHAYFEVGTLNNPIWGQRWDAIKQHYRQTFRIDRRWMDRIESFRPERLSILDPETGTRAPADVYADYAELPTARRMAETRNDPSRRLAFNKKAWEINDTTRKLSDGHLAEGSSVQVLDRDLGIFRIAFNAMPQRLGVIPSILSAKEDGAGVDIPVADPRVGLGMFLLHRGRLSQYHRMSVVLSVTPGSPQGLERFYKIAVTPAGAKEMLPPSIADRVKDCKGPRWQVVLLPGYTTARFAWPDSPGEKDLQAAGAIVDGLPRSEDRLIDPDHLKAVAKAVAAALYSGFTDRWEGSLTGALDPGRKPVGRIASVAHEVRARGVATTSLQMPRDLAPSDFLALLPQGTRNQLFGAVQL
jgi:hypothetical protein